LGISGAAASWLIWYICSSVVCVCLINRRVPVRTYSTLLYPTIASMGLATMLLVEGRLAQWALLTAIIVSSVIWAWRQRLFQYADLAILEAVGVPRGVRQLAAMVYRAR